MPIDPACGVEVDPDDPGAVATYDGDVYAFCSEGCKEHFEDDPEQYLENYDHTVPLSHVDQVLTQHVPIEDGTGTFELSVAEPGRLSVGDEVSYTRTLTDDHVQQFANITGDSNALHLSDSFAERTRFEGRVVHGALVSGLISAALAALPGMTVFLSQNVDFKRPVEIGETVTATCKVVEALEDDQYCLTVRADKEDGTSAIQGTAKVLIDDLAELT